MPTIPLLITSAVQTCRGCPSAWRVETWDGERLSLRYRWGVGTVTREDGTQVTSFSTNDPYDGVISLREFCTRSGLLLEDDASIA